MKLTDLILALDEDQTFIILEKCPGELGELGEHKEVAYDKKYKVEKISSQNDKFIIIVK